MTGEYTFVTPERQNELTRRIQEKLAEAAKKVEEQAANGLEIPPSTEAPPNLADASPATTPVQ